LQDENDLVDFEIKLTFGLHLGWSIEGINGSNFRIDTLYQSRNVNLSRYLQTLTNDYKVEFLFSDEIADNLSDKAKYFIRPLDIININYDNTSLKISNFKTLIKYFSELYTIDLDLDNLPIEEDIELIETNNIENVCFIDYIFFLQIRIFKKENLENHYTKNCWLTNTIYGKNLRLEILISLIVEENILKISWKFIPEDLIYMKREIGIKLKFYLLKLKIK